MPSVIEFVDGNTQTVLRRIPFDEVPPANREVYLRKGIAVATREEADEIVPIARVVRLLVDAAGRPAAADEATGTLIQEYDTAGVLRRETRQIRPR